MADADVIAAKIAAQVQALNVLYQAHAEAQTRTSALLEGGQRIDTRPYQVRDRRVYGVDGTLYLHCADAPDGEWIYRAD